MHRRRQGKAGPQDPQECARCVPSLPGGPSDHGHYDSANDQSGREGILDHRFQYRERSGVKAPVAGVGPQTGHEVRTGAQEGKRCQHSQPHGGRREAGSHAPRERWQRG